MHLRCVSLRPEARACFIIPDLRSRCPPLSQRFGTSYYIGVGYDHLREQRSLGPHCAPCKQDYNYPCAWANALALVGHVQSLTYIANRYSIAQVSP